MFQLQKNIICPSSEQLQWDQLHTQKPTVQSWFNSKMFSNQITLCPTTFGKYPINSAGTFPHNQLGELFFIKVPTRSVMGRGINADSGLFNQ
jgi:hypothetical protein